MVRQLSAAGSTTQKWFFLAAWLFVFGDIVFIVLHGGGMPSPAGLVTLVVIFLAPLAVASLIPETYKRVRMSDLGLFVSDNRREIFVPFSAIASAERMQFETSAFIEIVLSAPSEFGDRIRFAPRGRCGFLPWPDPAVREFLQRVNAR